MTENSEQGRVRWFNQKRGFGFVEIITPNSEFLNKDIFLHYSSIECNNGFKKVYPGEYISLNVVKNTKDVIEGREYVCQNVKGIHGNPLLIDNEEYNYKVIEKKERIKRNYSL